MPHVEPRALGRSSPTDRLGGRRGAAEGSWPQERNPRRGAAERCSRMDKNGVFHDQSSFDLFVPQMGGIWMGRGELKCPFGRFHWWWSWMKGWMVVEKP